MTDQVLPTARSVWRWFNSLIEIDATGTPEQIIAAARKIRGQQQFFAISLGILLCSLSFMLNSGPYSAFEIGINWVFGDRSIDGSLLKFVGLPLSKNIAKFSLMLILLWVFWSILVVNEPFSNEGHISNLSAGIEVGWAFPYNLAFDGIRRDIGIYAQLMPSVTLDRVCERCSQRDLCSNFVPTDSEYRTRHAGAIWSSVLPSLERRELASLLGAVGRCRLVHYQKVVLFVSIVFWVFAYGFHRLLEVASGFLSVNILPPCIGILIFEVLALWFLGAVNQNVNLNNLSGVWARFQGRARSVASHPTVRELHAAEYQRHICSRNGSKIGFQMSPESKEAAFRKFESVLLKGVLSELDKLVASKLKRLIDSDGPRHAKKDEHAKAVLDAITRFFSSEFDDGAPFKVRRVNELEAAFSHVEESALIEEICGAAEVEIASKGIFLLSRSANIKRNGCLEGSGGSMLIMPIGFEPDHIDTLKHPEFPTRPNRIHLRFSHQGFIIIRSGSSSIFRDSMRETLLLVLRPFIHRVAFELTRNELAKGGAERG